MVRLAVLQPSYLPWLGYLEQIAKSDVFVFYDDVQFDKNGWRNRNRIRTSATEGWSWLTIPVRIESHFPPINTVRINDVTPWRRKHRKTIEMAYAKAPHRQLFERYFGEFFSGEGDLLVDAAIDSIKALMTAYGLDTPTYRSSELGVFGDRNSRLLNLCKHFNATHYYSGAAAKVYLDEAMFEREGITVEWQDYKHPIYKQVAEPFISHLSALDAFLCEGVEARELLR